MSLLKLKECTTHEVYDRLLVYVFITTGFMTLDFRTLNLDPMAYKTIP